MALRKVGYVLRTVRYTIVAVILAVIIGVSFFSQFFTDMWWFAGLGYLKTFWVQIGWLWGVRLAGALAAMLFLLLNLWLTRPQVAAAVSRLSEHISWSPSWRQIRWVYVLVSLALGALYGAAIGPSWQQIAFFLNRQPFGVTDPIYHKDVGFYVFTLPFYDLVNSLALGLFTLALLITGAIYLFSGGFSLDGFKLHMRGIARWHLSLLLAGIVGLKAWRYGLNLYDLLYSSRGAIFGAGYTDMHANAIALKVLMALAALVALGILINIVGKGTRLIVSGLAALIIASVALGGVYPGLVQKFLVEPNELVRETPYIDNHITMTRAAYGLSNISERVFAPKDELTPAQVRDNSATFDNIRLWDWRPLLSAYGQLQEFRLYYDFDDVDIDRYMINGNYRQVMLAAREMAAESLQNPTWINQHLQYTHGYGIVASPVNRVTTEGLPEFFVSDIPPRGVAEMKVDRPQIYYGEKTNQYVIVNTKAQEFDYPKGDTNATATYSGHGGVQLSNPLKRLAFAVRFGTAKMLLSTDITSQSRVMLYRNIHERVRKIAPFLRYDNDPYIVVAGGKLYWIQDAYTTTDRFPYARPAQGWGNYVRNSVKVVIDAYNGDVTYYMVDEKEPIAAALQHIWGGLFKPLSSMPAELQKHLRYPEDLFQLQSSLYAIYHMTDTQVFYNQEDAWNIPNETYGNSQQAVEPYYVIMRLPGGQAEELVLLMPFTPASKDNMVAWLAARNDGANYGNLVVYKFPKQSLTFGPSQVEARINQDAQISQLLTLWSQKGSQVIRGNLLVIPVANTLVYAEPLYLQSEQSQLPELKRVIVAQGDRLAMGQNMAEALEQLIGARVTGIVSGATAQTGGVPLSPAARKVTDAYSKVKQRLQAGDWAGFGQAMSELDQAIRTLQQTAAQ